MVTIALDTNVVVALVDDRDTWHNTAATIRDALIEAQVPLVYFDCVFNETVGVIGRRTEERKRPEQFDRLLDGLTAMIPLSNITWIAGTTQRLFHEIMRLCRESHGTLNLHPRSSHCASASIVSASGSQKAISIARYNSMAVANAAQASVRCPTLA